MSKIGTDEIQRMAKLARIGLSADEAAQMSVQLGQILEFVEQLNSVDVTNTAPTDQVTGLVDVWREDEIRPSMDRSRLLAGAPAQQDGYIVVKRVLNG